MKNTLKLTALALALITLIGLTACSSDKKEGKKNSSSDSMIKIEDIDWSVDETIDDGERFVALNYTNNSEYSVVGFELTFNEKSKIKKEDKEQYFEDIKVLLEVDESDKDDMEDFKEIKSMPISMHTECKKVVKKGETASTRLLYNSGYVYVKNIKHYDYVTPDILTLKYISGEEIITEYYDFTSDKYTKDSKTEKAFYWTKNALKDIALKPNAEYVEKDFTDDDDEFSFIVHGWSEDDLSDYIQSCKEAGFNVNVSQFGTVFHADSQNGYHVYITYDEDDETADVDFELKNSDAQDTDDDYEDEEDEEDI